MSELYFRKKEQLSNPVQKSSVVDSHIELEKKRASSPTPVARSSSISVDKKIAFKTDIDDVSKKIDALNVESTVVSAHQKELEAQISDLLNKVDSLSKIIESTKYEQLKNTINDAILKMNASIRNVCDEMIKQQDKLSGIESQLTTIESMF